MDINQTIQFIKNCRGLRFGKASAFEGFIVFPIMFLIVFFYAHVVGGMFVIASAFFMLFIFVTDVVYLVISLKNSSPKHKLFLRSVTFLNCIAPLFYVCCLLFYDIFGAKGFFLYYFLPFLIGCFVFVAVGLVLTKKRIGQRTKTAFPLLCSVLIGMRALISRKVNGLMEEKLSQNTHILVIAVLMLLLSCFVFSVSFFDMQRYYYYTKLEKMGLVTQDILKPEE